MKLLWQNIEQSFYKHYILWTFLLITVGIAIQSLLFYARYNELFYVGTDCYTRALRIVDWLGEFQWHEKIFPYLNPPHGFVLHFTRICDVIWLLLAAPFLLFMPLKEAIFYGGFLFSPLFMILTVILMLWGLKPYLPATKGKQALFLFFALLAPYAINQLTSAFVFSRPDHHSLMACIMCAGIAVVLRNYDKPNLKHLFWLGILCSLGMWASSALEGLFVAAGILTVLAVNQIFYKHNKQELTSFSMGLFLGVAAAWLINPPYGGYSIIDINRLSVVHLVLTFLMFSAFWGLSFIKSENKIVLIFTLGAAALTCAALMLLIFGVHNILVPIYDPVVYRAFVQKVGEMQHQSLLSYETPCLILGIISVICLLHFSKNNPAYLVNLLIFYGFAGISSLICRRFFPYYVVVYTIIFGLTLFALASGAQKSDKLKWLTVIYITLHLFYFNSLYNVPRKLEIPQMKPTALVNFFYAPKLVFQQEIDAIGGPYHTNVEGITDNDILWYSTDEDTLKMLIKKHNIHSIYLTADIYPHMYPDPKNNTDKLYGKIITGKQLYPWLIKIDDGHYEIDYELLEQ